MGGLTLPGHFSYKELDRRDSVVKEGEYLGTNFRGYMDVGDGCWRPNVLMTRLRYW